MKEGNQKNVGEGKCKTVELVSLYLNTFLKHISVFKYTALTKVNILKTLDFFSILLI